jgi:hypothetical protein
MLGALAGLGKIGVAAVCDFLHAGVAGAMAELSGTRHVGFGWIGSFAAPVN